jgi:hypothetical protein
VKRRECCSVARLLRGRLRRGPSNLVGSSDSAFSDSPPAIAQYQASRKQLEELGFREGQNVAHRRFDF